MTANDQVKLEEGLTDEVVASFGSAPSARFREVMTLVVRHLTRSCARPG